MLCNDDRPRSDRLFIVHNGSAQVLCTCPLTVIDSLAKTEEIAMTAKVGSWDLDTDEDKRCFKVLWDDDYEASDMEYFQAFCELFGKYQGPLGDPRDY